MEYEVGEWATENLLRAMGLMYLNTFMLREINWRGSK